jgi:hypothetical protein
MFREAEMIVQVSPLRKIIEQSVELFLAGCLLDDFELFVEGSGNQQTPRNRKAQSEEHQQSFTGHFQSGRSASS